MRNNIEKDNEMKRLDPHEQRAAQIANNLVQAKMGGIEDRNYGALVGSILCGLIVPLFVSGAEQIMLLGLLCTLLFTGIVFIALGGLWFKYAGHRVLRYLLGRMGGMLVMTGVIGGISLVSITVLGSPSQGLSLAQQIVIYMNLVGMISSVLILGYMLSEEFKAARLSCAVGLLASHASAAQTQAEKLK